MAISRHDGRLDGFDAGLPILADASDGHEGPLAGLLAGLDWVAMVRPDASHAVTVPVDSPFLPRRLRRAAPGRGGRDGRRGLCGGFRRPSPSDGGALARGGTPRPESSDAGRGLYAASASSWTASTPPRPSGRTTPFDPFLNLNTPEDLAAAEAIVLGRRADAMAQMQGVRAVLVADVMTRDVEFVEASTTIAEAAVAMGDLGVGALPVGTADDLQGIITDRDILFRVVARGLSNKTVTVGEVMTTTIFSCRQEDSITTALNLMGARNLRRLPVLDLNGRTIGLVTLADLSRRMLLDSGVVQRGVAELSGAPS